MSTEVSLSPQCEAASKKNQERLNAGHQMCEDLRPDGSGCGCKCHDVIARELAAVGISSLDEWPWSLHANGCECCGLSEITCDGVKAGGFMGMGCNADLDGGSITELRRSIAWHLISTQHIITERDSTTGKYIMVRRGEGVVR